MASNKLFTSKVTSNNSSISKMKVNREYLISQDVAQELNTYASFSPFNMFAEIYSPEYEKVGSNWEEKKNIEIKAAGTRSLFNKFSAVTLDGVSKTALDAGELRISNNVPLLDSRDNRQKIKELSKCTVRDLVAASEEGLLGRETYSYSDFMYCKYLGKIPNNYMITLRRFPFPVDDYIATTGTLYGGVRKNTNVASKNAQSIGCMVTWMGAPGNEMNNILKYDVSMPFDDRTADWQDNSKTADNHGGIFNKMANLFDNQYRQQYMEGQAGGATTEYLNRVFHLNGTFLEQGGPPYRVGQFSQCDQNKVYGPVDAVKKTKIRGKDGIDFTQSFELEFDYELRAYNGINTRQAMLDLLANILTVTYTTGTFWGGGYKPTGSHQNNIFANLEIFKVKGGFNDYIEAFSNDYSTITKSITDSINAAGGFRQAFKAALNSLGGMLLGGALNSFGRPDKVALNSLLSPAPVGFWHVTVGNPFHPILSVGNMVLTKTSIEHYGPLGLDDFPTGLKVKCSLERAKPRDSREIEKMYMQGNERIFYSMTSKVFDMYKHAKEYGQKEYSTGVYNPNSGDKKEYEEYDEGASALLAKDSSIKLSVLNKVKNVLQKYFGQTDVYSIQVASCEQEYGNKSKPKEKTNENK